MSELELLAPFSGTLLDVVPVGVAISDYSGRVFAANRAMAALTGYSEQEQKERGADSMYALPEERERIVEEVLRSGSARGREARFKRKDGSFIVVCIDMVMVKSGGKTLLVTTAQDISQRKKAEDDLRKAERERVLILDSAAEMIVYYDLDLRIRWANKASAVSVGMEPGELVGKRCYEIWHRRGEPCEHCPVLLARDTGLPKEREDATPDGRHFFLRGYPVFDDRGRVSGMVEFSLDVTARKNAERALRESEEQLRLITDNLPVLISYVDSDLRYRFNNRTYEKWLGVPRERILGKRMQEVMGASNFERIAAFVDKTLAGESMTYESVNTYSGGVVRVTRSTTIPHFGDDGKPKGLFALIEDITARKKVEESLRESSQFNQQIIACAREGVIVYDKELRYLVWNPYMEELSGLAADRVIGKKPLDVFPYLEETGLWEGLIKALSGETVYHPEYLYRLPHGNKAGWATSIQAPFLNARGEIIGVIENVHDMTSQKENEEKRKKLEEQLFQAQKMESVGRLAGGIAHDFNNLLTSIIGNAELALMSMTAEAPVYSDMLEIKKAADRAANLTRQLLAFSRKQIIEPKVLNVNETILDMDKMLRRLIGENIRLVTSLDEGLSCVKMDPGQVEQILTNLVVNARDAMPKGGTVSIETENVILDEEYTRRHFGASPGSYVRVSVTDTGVGMDETVKSHLFEPFFTTKEKGKGTGLGLSTCYGIVKQNRGYISFWSEPGRGTSVEVFLPMVQGTHVPEERDRGGPLPKGKETILVVEDEPTVRGMIRRILAGNGYRVLEASGGAEAFEAVRKAAVAADETGERVREKKLDLLLTDVVMPSMGGKELADALKNDFPGLMVLYMSGYTDDSIVQQGVLDEGIAFIQKPFSPAALIQKVRETLDG